MYMHGLYLPMITVLEIKMKYLIFKIVVNLLVHVNINNVFPRITCSLPEKCPKNEFFTTLYYLVRNVLKTQSLCIGS